MEGPLNKGEDSLTIMDVAVDGGWNLATLSFSFPNSVLSDVLSTPLHRFSIREDMKSWISYLNGGFHPKNAYLLIVEEDLKVPDFRGKWLRRLNTPPPFLPPKIHIFLWKWLHQSLSVKSTLAQRGIEALGGCGYCPDIEDIIIHVLRDCPIAKRF